jgi:hypothetical protein
MKKRIILTLTESQAADLWPVLKELDKLGQPERPAATLAQVVWKDNGVFVEVDVIPFDAAQEIARLVGSL